MHSLHKAMALLEWLPYQKSNPNSALGPYIKQEAGFSLQRSTLTHRPIPLVYSPGPQCLSPWNDYTQNELHLWPPQKPIPKVSGAVLVSIPILRDIAMLIISPKNGAKYREGTRVHQWPLLESEFPLTTDLCVWDERGIGVSGSSQQQWQNQSSWDWAGRTPTCRWT